MALLKSVEFQECRKKDNQALAVTELQPCDPSMQPAETLVGIYAEVTFRPVPSAPGAGPTSLIPTGQDQLLGAAVVTL